MKLTEPAIMEFTLRKPTADEVLLFLDFDGVLHPYPSYKKLFSNMASFEQLMDANPNVVVVLSTAWRFDRGIKWDDLLLLFREDLRDRFIGMTCVMRPIYEVRDLEIKHWMSTNNWTGEFAVLDDRQDFFKMLPEIRKRLMLCNPIVGMNTRQVTELTEFFKKQLPKLVA